MNSLNTGLNTIKAECVKHSPEIAIAIGIAGFIGTAIMAVKATPKAMVKMEEARQRKIDEAMDEGCIEDENVQLTTFEKVKVAAPCYVLPIITGALSIGCIIFSRQMYVGKIAGLTSTCTVLSEGFREYKMKVKEVIGEKKEAKIREEIACDKIKRAKIPANAAGEFSPTTGLVPCIDALSGDCFYASKQMLEDLRSELNERFTEYGGYEEWIPNNDFRAGVKLRERPFGENLGWNIQDGPIAFYYGSDLLPDGTPALCISYDYSTKDYEGINKERAEVY